MIMQTEPKPKSGRIRCLLFSTVPLHCMDDILYAPITIGSIHLVPHRKVYMVWVSAISMTNARAFLS